MSARSRPWELSLQLLTQGSVKARVCGSVVIGVCTNVYCDNLLLVSAVRRRLIGEVGSCTIMVKAPTRAFSRLKAATTAFTFKTPC